MSHSWLDWKISSENCFHCGSCCYSCFQVLSAPPGWTSETDVCQICMFPKHKPKTKTFFWASPTSADDSLAFSWCRVWTMARLLLGGVNAPKFLYKSLGGIQSCISSFTSPPLFLNIHGFMPPDKRSVAGATHSVLDILVIVSHPSWQKPRLEHTGWEHLSGMEASRLPNGKLGPCFVCKKGMEPTPLHMRVGKQALLARLRTPGQQVKPRSSKWHHPKRKKSGYQ